MTYHIHVEFRTPANGEHAIADLDITTRNKRQAVRHRRWLQLDTRVAFFSIKCG